MEGRGKERKEGRKEEIKEGKERKKRRIQIASIRNQNGIITTGLTDIRKIMR